MTGVRLPLLVLTIAIAGLAQYPGQYPPGQYPPGRNPGRYPPNGGGPTGPTGSQGGGPPQLGRGRSGNSKNNTAISTTTYGIFRIASGRQFVIEADDHRIITYRTSTATIVEKDNKTAEFSAFTPGDHLVVDSTEDDQGYYTATAVKFEKAATSADRELASIPWNLPRLDGSGGASNSASSPQREPGDDRPIMRRGREEKPPEASKQDAPKLEPPKQEAAQQAKAEPVEEIDPRPTTTMRQPPGAADPDDPGPPSLRHGAPTPRRQPAQVASSSGPSSSGPVILSKPPDEPAPAPASASETIRTVVPFEEDPGITKARAAAEDFAGSIPNFFCQQITTRYHSDHPKTGWDPLDIVTADLAYEDGKESYKNIKVGNKPVKKDMGDIDGTRSTGEFASILEDLFSPATGATFRRTGQETIRGRQATVYKFDVQRERSHWRIEAPSQIYYPAFTGSIWVDKQTSRVMRIEQQTKNMALLFPFDTVETATDYDSVRLSTPTQYLLPVSAEVLSCTRGTSSCTRNRIEFRNYRKFGSESNITFDGKDPQKQ